MWLEASLCSYKAVEPEACGPNDHNESGQKQLGKQVTASVPVMSCYFAQIWCQISRVSSKQVAVSMSQWSKSVTRCEVSNYCSDY